MKECQYGEQKPKYPVWYVNGKVNDLAFLQTIRKQKPLVCVHGTFFDVHEQPVEDAEVLKLIVEELSQALTTNLNGKSRELLSLMRSFWNYIPPDVSEDVIHFANGTYHVYDQRFDKEKEFTLHRLSAYYQLTEQKPVQFLDFLDQLLYPEDIPTLQEFLGYCLIPTNRAQKMLVISGKGGEGKSVLGTVIRHLFGTAAVFNSVQKISTSPFARADLEHKLVMVDDDMSLSALSQTHILKTLVTLEGETDLERKGKQSYQGRIYTRFIGLTNGNLSALYDQSDGFFRRQIMLKTKPRDKDRVDNPYLADYLFAETPAILQWCLEGLYRLRQRDYRFTISERARENLRKTMQEADSIRSFLHSRGYIQFDPKRCVSSADLTAAYKRFCQENDLLPLSDTTFRSRFSGQAEELGLIYTKHIPTQNRKDIRGYLGIGLDMPASW